MQIIKPLRRKRTKRKHLRKKGNWRDLTETCKLCNKSSASLQINKACLCVADDSFFTVTSTLLNGKTVFTRTLKKEMIPALKNAYNERLNQFNANSRTLVIKGYDGQIKKKKAPIKNIKASRKDKNEFYQSWEWKKLRFEILKLYGAKCMLCGATNQDSKICVDHIKPLGSFWHLRLDVNNLQVLCNDCNMGKSTEEIDFRSHDEK